MRLSSLIRSAPLAGAIAVPLVVMAAPASQAADRGPGAAYGMIINGLVDLPATPTVESAKRKPIRRSVSDLPENPVADASALEASAWAGNGRASVSDLRISRELFNAEVVTAKCVGNKGHAHLGKAFLKGKRLAATPKPNSVFKVPVEGFGTASVVLNSQRRDAWGRLTVTAVEVNLPRVAGKLQKIGVASATCASKGKWHGPSKPHKPYKPHKPHEHHKPYGPHKPHEHHKPHGHGPGKPHGHGPGKPHGHGPGKPGRPEGQHGIKPTIPAPVPTPTPRNLPVTG